MALDLETHIFTSSEELSVNDCNSAVNDMDTTAPNSNEYDLIDEKQKNNIQTQLIAAHITNMLCQMDRPSTFNTPSTISVDTPKFIEMVDEKQIHSDHITNGIFLFSKYYSDQMCHSSTFNTFHSYDYSLDQSLTNIASEEQIIIKEERQHEEYPSPNLMFGYSTETYASQSLGTPSYSLGTPSQSSDTSLELVVTPSQSIDIDDYKHDTCNNLETIDE
eukprot:59257_1